MLDDIKDFLDLTEENNIAWCHWKSNLSLDKALNGKTDLDLLFYEKDKTKLEEIFYKIGAVKFDAVKKYEKIDDFIAVDKKTSNLIHFHVHYQLDVGESGIKNFRLPFAEKVIESRIKHQDFNFWISNPEYELILLVLRQVLRVPIYRFWINKIPSIGKNTKQEYEWLKNRINKDELKRICTQSFPEKINVDLLDIAQNEMTIKKIVKFNKKLRPFMEKYKQKNLSKSLLRSIIDKLIFRIKRLMLKISIPIVIKRTFCRQGIIIVFVGCDGSGKSSLVNEVYKVFNQKIDTAKVYFGHGVSNKSFLLFVFKIISKTMNKLLNILRIKTDIPNIIMTIGITLHKKRSFNLAHKMKKKGVLVVCDRFPQMEFYNINDGLKLSKYITSKNWVLKSLAKWERNIYEQRETIFPDVAFKIIVEPQIALNRKNDGTKIETIIKKNDITKKVKMPQKTKVFEIINDNISFEELKSDVINKIWQFIIKNQNV